MASEKKASKQDRKRKRSGRGRKREKESNLTDPESDDILFHCQFPHLGPTCSQIYLDVPDYCCRLYLMKSLNFVAI